LGAAGGVAFVALAERARTGKVTRLEERAFRAVNRISPAIRGPVWMVMQAGSLPAVGAAAIAARRRSRSTSIGMAVAGTAVWALAKAVKRVIRRGRPADHLDDVTIHGATQSGLGFPSGHAAVATTLASVGSRVLPAGGARAAWLAALVVGGARQYVGAHLPLDVAGGVAMGVTAGALTNLALDMSSSLDGHGHRRRVRRPALLHREG
jgi:undecaprenyl-diphosphatase